MYVYFFKKNKNTMTVLSIRSEEVPLFLVLLIHINTHNRMEINL